MARRSTKTPPPDDFEERILDIDVVDEMQGSFLEYAYSVIYSRALPDARDGLKPVHRRILYQMNEMGLRPDRGYVKCARVVGEVMGKLHPHGDAVDLRRPGAHGAAVLDARCRWSTGTATSAPSATTTRRPPCGTPSAGWPPRPCADDGVDRRGHGRLRAQLRRPGAGARRPARRPSRTCWSTAPSGIAVGMATNMPPHNLGEVVAAARHLIKHPDADLDDLMRFVPGPDLPTGGRIVGLQRHPGRLRDRPRHLQDPRHGRGRARHGRAARASSSPNCPSPSAPRRSSPRSRTWSAPRSSRASPTSRTSPTARTACAWSSRSRTASSRRPSWSSSTG